MTGHRPDEVGRRLGVHRRRASGNELEERELERSPPRLLVGERYETAEPRHLALGWEDLVAREGYGRFDLFGRALEFERAGVQRRLAWQMMVECVVKPRTERRAQFE